MDNLDSLFEKKYYDLVIKLTEKSTDPKDLFLRISSFVCLGKYEEAYHEVKLHAQIVEEKYPFQIMKIEFEILLELEMFDEAKKRLEYYENRPYISQEAEEYMQDLKDRIENASKPHGNKSYTPDEICEILEHESNQAIVSQVVFSLKNYNINIYIDSLKFFLKRDDVHPNFRTYALILLVDNKFDEDVEFLSLNGLIKVNPKNLFPPFLGKKYNEVIHQISELAERNTTYINTAIHLFNCYIIDTYPMDIYAKNDAKQLAQAFLYLSLEYMNADKFEVDKDVDGLIKNIRYIIQSTPDIKL